MNKMEGGEAHATKFWIMWNLTPQLLISIISPPLSWFTNRIPVCKISKI